MKGRNTLLEHFTEDALLRSLWRNFRPFPSIWLNFTPHTAKSAQTFLNSEGSFFLPDDSVQTKGLIVDFGEGCEGGEVHQGGRHIDHWKIRII